MQGTRLAALFDALEKNRELQRHLRGVMDKVRDSSGWLHAWYELHDLKWWCECVNLSWIFTGACFQVDRVINRIWNDESTLKQTPELGSRRYKTVGHSMAMGKPFVVSPGLAL